MTDEGHGPIEVAGVAGARLRRLEAAHAPAVLAFERANRAYFTRFISDRGDDYFARFGQWFQALLDEQAHGTSAFYVLVDEDGAVLGRFNMVDIVDGAAELGYRVAESAAGRGVATSAVRALCGVAGERHGVRRLKAGASDANVASQRVLVKAGFTLLGPADPAHLGGKPGRWYTRELAVPAEREG